MDVPLPTSALFASFHSGRCVFQPDAGFGDKVGQLDEQRNEELLGQIHQAHTSPLVPDEFAIGAHGPNPLPDEVLMLPIEHNRIFRVRQQGVIGLDAIGDVGVGEDFSRQEGTQRRWIVAVQNLKEFSR